MKRNGRSIANPDAARGGDQRSGQPAIEVPRATPYQKSGGAAESGQQQCPQQDDARYSSGLPREIEEQLREPFVGQVEVLRGLLARIRRRT